MMTHAQVADTLKEVKVKAKKGKGISDDERINTYSPGQTIITIDSTTLKYYEFQDMANLLSQQVPVFVKSYGMNNIATLNFRGASAAQSQVYWNGIPIQNAALGIADVSLLPVSLMNKVNVVYGSSSALWGSGNVGGAVMVENELPDFDKEGSFTQSISAVAASYGSYHIGLKTSLSTGRLALSANLFGQSAQNNFNYTDADDKQQKMQNAKLQNGVGLLQGAYKVNDNNLLTARVWYQQYYREIPRALFESVSVKNQRDESLRAMLQWDKKIKKHDAYLKTAYIQDGLWYRDSVVKLDSRNTVQQLYVETGVTHNFNSRHKLLLFVPVNLAWMEQKDSAKIISQNRYALAAAYLYSTIQNRLQISLNGRAEVVDTKSYLLPGVNASYKFSPHFSIRANVQRTYRVPTLNELYYNPGGNPNLKPERGWNEDIGYTITTGRYVNKAVETTVANKDADYRRKLVVTHNLSIYNRNVHDWIIWFGGAIWTPHNIATVHSRGLQTENTGTYKINKNLELKLGVNASYTLATTVNSYLPGDGSIGKQIPYTPLYNGQGNLGVKWKQLYINYNHSYTGLRYITTDESFSLAAYSIGNLQAMYQLPLADNELRFTAQCNNIWNEDYVVVQARPMPGINWLLGVSFTFGR